jgi:trehalose-6-phosphate synthase
MSYACNFQLMIYLSLLFFLCSDVALVTSLRDGMNLVSYEFVACQDAKKGVLILSEVITKTYQVWLCPIIFFSVKDKLESLES